ncbi:DUF4255 domain-containing protein [Enterobacter roggenkampii]|uniref:DUF4255 domain-containing protein n=1 Tax=Enterobacter roggenkampii TaxID=1812935 RepID=UPI002DB90402|nr:DUF4255 domain-containing protein [Enterobacter roggenkampii]MEB5890006.1 DUF4255 domain-containing protein [Enterobacter roggenkampii]
MDKKTLPMPDMTVININKEIKTMLMDYLAEGIDIRFDLPDTDNLPAEPVVSVFLYDIHEDLPLRTSHVRHYDPVKGMFTPDQVNISCNYLITYWDSGKQHAGKGGADNQSIWVMNQVLNALLNNRELKNIPGTVTKVIPPKDELNGLGNFWQALGNKPRLLLNYSVTTPMSLQGRPERTPSIQQPPELTMQPGAAEATHDDRTHKDKYHKGK